MLRGYAQLMDAQSSLASKEATLELRRGWLAAFSKPAKGNPDIENLT